MAAYHAREDALTTIVSAKSSAPRSVQNILHAARAHLGMDFAFVSEFQEHDRIFRYTDGADPLHPPLRAGDRLPLDAGYCQRIVQGELPELIPDTAGNAVARRLPETSQVPIGSHIGVPVRLANGQLYGTFCCFSYDADRSLNERDLGLVRTMAELIGQQLDLELEQMRQHDAVVERLNTAIRTGQPRPVYQPIFGADDTQICGVECLSRFYCQPRRPPDVWFREAGTVGLRCDLELLAIRTALTELRAVPGDFYIACNSSPQTILSGRMHEALNGIAPERLVLEITEHDYVDDYAELLRALQPLRDQGIRIAIDDAGAGYSSMRHILCIHPELIKLDISLTQNIHEDSMRSALARALLEFARHSGSTIIAEGVETAEELQALCTLGVPRIQGYFLSRPLRLVDLLHLLQCQSGPKT